MERHACTDDAAAIARAAHPVSWGRRLATFETLDPQFAATWSDHVSRLFARPQLDLRQRLLVLAAQYTMRGDLEALEETLEAATDAGLDMREPLEAILQCYVYAGQRRVSQAAGLPRRGTPQRLHRRDPRRAAAGGRTRAGGPSRPIGMRTAPTERILGSKRSRPYGFHGFGSGLRLRPGHHINLVTTLDAVDPGFLQIWLDTIYERMYSRGVIDDATRLLCVVANCFAVGETHQARRHMRGALRQGADPIELLEVIFQA